MLLQSELRQNEIEDERPSMGCVLHQAPAKPIESAPPCADASLAPAGNRAPGSGIDITLLATQHGRRLYQFIARRVDNIADAQDLMQITYIEAWLHADRFRGDSLPQTWLFGIALNVVRNFKSRSSGYRFVFEDIDDGLHDQVDDHDPYWHNALRQRCQCVAQQLAASSPAIQALAELVFVEELSYAEAAERLAVPVGTVRSRLARLREKLIAAEEERHGQ